MQRVLRYDGLLPTRMDEQGQHVGFTADHLREMTGFIDANRSATTPFDIVVEGRTLGADPDRAAEVTRMWADGGATWWIEALWGDPDQPADLDAVLLRIRQGPPRFD